MILMADKISYDMGPVVQGHSIVILTTLLRHQRVKYKMPTTYANTLLVLLEKCENVSHIFSHFVGKCENVSHFFPTKNNSVFVKITFEI